MTSHVCVGGRYGTQPECESDRLWKEKERFVRCDPSVIERHWSQFCSGHIMRALFLSRSLPSSLSYSSTSHTHTLNSTLRLFPLPSQVKYPPSSLSVTLSLDWKSIHLDTTLLDKTLIFLDRRPPWEYSQSTLTGSQKKATEGSIANHPALSFLHLILIS